MSRAPTMTSRVLAALLAERQMTAAELRRCFPDANPKSVAAAIQALREQGRLSAIAPGVYRFRPPPPAPPQRQARRPDELVSLSRLMAGR